jgi:archaellum component FlaG (FlaF/FlaG flagellin family)
MALSTTITSQIQAKLTSTVGLASNTASISNSETDSLTSATKLYSATVTVATSTTEDIDLSGTLTDPLGEAAVFTDVYAIFIKNTGEAALTLGGANQVPIINGSTDKINLAAGCSLQYIDPAGVSVTAGTGDLISLTAGATASEAEIIVIGK